MAIKLAQGLLEWCDSHMEARQKSVDSMKEADAISNERTIMDFSLEIAIYQSFKNKIIELSTPDENN